MKRKSFVLLLVAPLLASCGDPAPKDYAVNEYKMKEIEAEKVTVSKDMKNMELIDSAEVRVYRKQEK